MAHPGPLMQIIKNEPSYCLQAGSTRVAITRTAGMMAPVTFFADSDRPVQPYYVSPWWNEGVTPDIPTLLAILRGDFFCAPFGGNDAPYEGCTYPPHGEPANAAWTAVNLQETARGTALEMEQKQTLRPGAVRKRVALRAEENVIYTQHVLEGMNGPITVGHHACLYIPDGVEPGYVSFAPHRLAHTYVQPTERPEARGYSWLKPDCPIDDLTHCPAVDGSTVDLTRWPARRGFEDIVIVCAAQGLDFGWTALSVPSLGYVWFLLKDPSVLVSSLMWMSNGGRHYAPWSGRNWNCLGLEEITGFFHEGLAPSVKENFLSAQGIATTLALDPSQPTAVNTIQGVARIEPDFKGVCAIEAVGHEAIRIVDSQGKSVVVPLQLTFLKSVSIKELID